MGVEPLQWRGPFGMRATPAAPLREKALESVRHDIKQVLSDLAADVAPIGSVDVTAKRCPHSDNP
jgi:hypothetical protein